MQITFNHLLTNFNEIRCIIKYEMFESVVIFLRITNVNILNYVIKIL